MTVPAQTRRSSVYTGNGVTLVFPFSFKVFAATDIQVLVTSVAGVLSTAAYLTDYSVTLNPDQSTAPGGSINYQPGFVPLATGAKLVIIGALPYDQPLSLPGGGNFNPAAIENELDRTQMQIQQLAAGLQATISVPVGETVPVLPAAAQRANYMLGFDALGNPIAVIPTSGSAGTLAIDIANAASPTKGAGQVGFTSGLGYAASTVGAALNAILATFTTFTTIASLAASAGSNLIGFIQSGTGATARTVQSKLRETISVLDFGADPTGVADSTAAFNLATQSTVAWSAALQYDILVPSGPNIKFKLNGTVYVRKGQTLRGTGHGASVDLTGNTTTNSFILGKGFIAGVATDDAGGYPVKIENLFTLGGAAAKGAVYTNAQGFEINSVFLTSPGIGIEIGAGAADGIISNCQVDQALTGFSFTSCQSILVVNTNAYLAGFGYVYNGSCFDIQLNGGVIEYSTIAAILFANGVSNIKGLVFSGINFVMNAQNAGTFQGFVQSRASNVDAQFVGCSFRNMYKWAISHQTNGPVDFCFSGCVFDGAPTNAAGYAASTTAMVLNTGLTGSYTFTGCVFRNLLGEMVTVNDNLSRLNIVGGSVTGCDTNSASQGRFNIVTTQVPPISVKGVKGFPYTFISGSNWACVLPWWGASTAYKVAVKGDTQNVGDSRYSAAEEGVYTVTWQNSGGTKSIYADKILLWKTPTRTNPGDLAAVVCLGSTPGGATSTTTFASAGTICVSVPFTNQSGFDFYAETAT